MHHPLGMSDPEWNRLTLTQQNAARQQQAEINRKEDERRAREQAEEARRKAAERRRVDALYASSRFGDIVECSLQGGIADFHPGWKKYRRMVFTVARGETKKLRLASAVDRDGVTFWSAFDLDGRTVSVCYDEPRGSYGGNCATLNGTMRNFARGLERTVKLKDILNGAKFSCSYPRRYRPWNDRRRNRRH